MVDLILSSPVELDYIDKIYEKQNVLATSLLHGQMVYIYETNPQKFNKIAFNDIDGCTRKENCSQTLTPIRVFILSQNPILDNPTWSINMITYLTFLARDIEIWYSVSLKHLYCVRSKAPKGLGHISTP